MKCIIDKNGGWKTDIISCLTPNQKKEVCAFIIMCKLYQMTESLFQVPVGGKVEEDNYMYECQRAPGNLELINDYEKLIYSYLLMKWIFIGGGVNMKMNMV